jgi:uncharacterized protein
MGLCLVVAAARRLGVMTRPEAGDEDIAELAGRVFDMARHEDADTLAAYLDAGVPVNLTNSKGDTLVMPASYYGHPETVRVLTARGADVNRPNDRGQPPSPASGRCPQAPVFKGEDEVVRLLLGVGADPYAGGPNAVETARVFGQTGYLEMFSSYRPKVGWRP